MTDKLRLEFINSVVQDLRAEFRTIWNAPGFALVSILTLALGIGANTAVFSVIYAVLLRPPAYPNGGRIVELLEAAAGQKPVSWINFQHWRNENHTFADMAGFETADVTLSGRGEAVLTHEGVVSASFFKLTGWRPATLSAVEIHGILNYWVGVRQKEIAIRLALGAQRAEIMQWTGWHALRQLLWASRWEVLGCWGVSRWLTSLVFGVSAQDPATLLAAGLAVIAVAALAASVPTWRASRVDVIRKLRDD